MERDYGKKNQVETPGTISARPYDKPKVILLLCENTEISVTM